MPTKAEKIGLVLSAAWAFTFLGLTVFAFVLAIASFQKHGFGDKTQFRLVEAGVCFFFCDFQARYTDKIINQLQEKYGISVLRRKK